MSDCCSSQQVKTACCCSPAPKSPKPPRTITGQWTFSDKLGHIFCRISNRFRNRYRIEPGLYAVGRPGPDSEVFVSANYRLSFDHLRKALIGMDCWVLVLDTKGINVWCAAGKGTFGTEELIHRIGEVRLDQIVEHRGIVVPQLGAPGVAAHEVKRRTGFRVIYGPVYARDIPEFVEGGYKIAPEFRRIRFGVVDRLILTPIELAPSIKWFGIFAILWLAVSGLGPSGIDFSHSWANGKPAIQMGLLGILCGSLLTPILLPFVPFRSFALKGALTGFPVALIMALVGSQSLIEILLSFVFVMSLSSFLAFNFTGASTFTSPSGVRREFKIAVPVYILAGLITLVLLVFSRMNSWGN